MKLGVAGVAVVGMLLPAAKDLYAQHCGPGMTYGCESTRTTDEWTSSNGLYRVVLQRGTTRTFEWSEREADGRYAVRHRFDLPGLEDSFYLKGLFISPKGRGFVVSGFPRAKSGPEDRRTPPDPWLVVSFGTDGRKLAAWTLSQLLTQEERVEGGSCADRPVAESCFRFVTLSERPGISKDGLFLDLKAAKSGRPIRVFLPLGRVVDDALDRALGNWLAATPEDLQRVGRLLAQFEDEDPARREQAAGKIREGGPVEFAALQHALSRSPPGESRARIVQLLGDLDAWSLGGGEAPPRDLPLLAGLTAYPKKEVSAAARRRLLAIAPRGARLVDATPDEIARWVERNAGRLSWDESSGTWKE